MKTGAKCEGCGYVDGPDRDPGDYYSRHYHEAHVARAALREAESQSPRDAHKIAWLRRAVESAEYVGD